ncbi:unnamed protein product [Gongylonema pulchrum]|uniref:P4Ha_N domain-containing protein n=1 Tax=Gongylonema pulchrum TaxID=637853 RepID=A0A183E6A9_9BILA|nr:unnamed protein product [Gongylonema pulchrum]
MRLITNPVSAYLLIRELIQNWNDIKNLVQDNIGEDLLEEIYKMRALSYAKSPTAVIFLFPILIAMLIASDSF